MLSNNLKLWTETERLEQISKFLYAIIFLNSIFLLLNILRPF